jgi:hypothetical protein
MYRVGICRGGATVTLGCWRARDGCRHDARWTRLSQIEAASRSGWSRLAATCHALTAAKMCKRWTHVVDLEGNRVHGL